MHLQAARSSDLFEAEGAHINPASDLLEAEGAHINPASDLLEAEGAHINPASDLFEAEGNPNPAGEEPMCINRPLG